MANPNETNPISGPFPDGDSRNITLTQSGNAFEPERTGPQEPIFRRDDAPSSVLGSLEATELKPGASAPAVNTNPEWTQLGTDTIGERIDRLTPGSDETSVMGDLLEKVGNALDLDLTSSSSGVQSDTINEGESNARVARYTLREDPAPSAAQTAFGLPGGNLEEPLLQEDWNPAERNSDDLSR